MNVTEKRREYKIIGDKNRELETFADKESRLLTRRVHRMKGETALQGRDNYKSCGNIRQREKFRMKHLIKGSKLCEWTIKYRLKGKHLKSEIKGSNFARMDSEWNTYFTPMLSLSARKWTWWNGHHPRDHFDVVMSVWLPLAALR